eukprot:GHVR01153664.1.p1 GENE.GHVR01153664.1~~GHVR01153664.1.p1  ORF type:complete len:171 (-),score=26.96 GHVR01153664.1:22-534(-)
MRDIYKNQGFRPFLQLGSSSPSSRRHRPRSDVTFVRGRARRTKVAPPLGAPRAHPASVPLDPGSGDLDEEAAGLTRFATVYRAFVDTNRDLRGTAFGEDHPLLQDSLFSGNRVTSSHPHGNQGLDCALEYRWAAPLRTLHVAVHVAQRCRLGDKLHDSRRRYRPPREPRC